MPAAYSTDDWTAQLEEVLALQSIYSEQFRLLNLPCSPEQQLGPQNSSSSSSSSSGGSSSTDDSEDLGQQLELLLGSDPPPATAASGLLSFEVLVPVELPAGQLQLVINTGDLVAEERQQQQQQQQQQSPGSSGSALEGHQQLEGSHSGSQVPFGPAVKHLPPVRVQLQLPVDYPSSAAAPPVAALHASWLCAEHQQALQQQLAQVWQEQGPGPLCFTLLEHIKVSALPALGIVDTLVLSLPMQQQQAQQQAQQGPEWQPSQLQQQQQERAAVQPLQQQQTQDVLHKHLSADAPAFVPSAAAGSLTHENLAHTSNGSTSSSSTQSTARGRRRGGRAAGGRHASDAGSGHFIGDGQQGQKQQQQQPQNPTPRQQRGQRLGQGQCSQGQPTRPEQRPRQQQQAHAKQQSQRRGPQPQQQVWQQKQATSQTPKQQQQQQDKNQGQQQHREQQDDHKQEVKQPQQHLGQQPQSQQQQQPEQQPDQQPKPPATCSGSSTGGVFVEQQQQQPGQQPQPPAACNGSSTGGISLDTLAMQLLRYDCAQEQEEFNNSSWTCNICFDTVPGSSCTRLPECRHFYCTPCLSATAAAQLDAGTVENMRCPEPSCRKLMPPYVVKQLLGSEQFARWEELVLNRALDRMDDVVYCPRCVTETVCVADKDGLALCPQCFFAFHAECGDSWHPGRPCINLEERVRVLGRRRRGTTAEDRMRDLDLMNQAMNLRFIAEASKCCPTCGMATMKNEGCNKMTCANCSRPWCWKCGQAITGYEHFRDNQLCVLFEQADIDRWHAMLFANRRAEEVDALHAGVIRGRAAPGARLCRCPVCGQENLREGRNNLLRCWSCASHYCYACGSTLRGKVGQHFVGSKACKQHGD